MGNGFVIPAGLLREPISAIQFADIIVWNGTKIPENIMKLKKDILVATYKILYFYDKNGNKFNSFKTDKPQNILVSGIGTPQSFENLIKEKGITFVEHFKFKDHYRYTKKSLEEIEKFVVVNSIKNVLITEKDWSKIKFIENNLNIIVVKAEFSIKNKEILKDL